MIREKKFHPQVTDISSFLRRMIFFCCCAEFCSRNSGRFYWTKSLISELVRKGTWGDTGFPKIAAILNSGLSSEHDLNFNSIQALSVVVVRCFLILYPDPPFRVPNGRASGVLNYEATP